MKGKEKTLKRVKKVANYNLANQDLSHKQSQEGITLVALVVTIIVLLILAGVTIMTLFGENGLITMAQKAKSETENAQANAIAGLGSLANEMNSIFNEDGNNGGGSTGGDEEGGETGSTATTITTEKINTVLSTTANTKLSDKYGNNITVPAGFKIVVDSTTGYTTETIDVTKGIVIEDVSAKDASTQGSQFVWIPVGKIYTDTSKTESLAKTVTLGRYENFTADSNGNYTPVASAETAIDGYYKELSTSTYGNATARSITDFITSANTNGGYYLGRYEASESGTTIACKAGQTVYTDMTQPTASDKSKEMYVDGYATGTYSSDLANSYAWDTAIVFFQTFEEANFANLTCDDVGSTELANTGSNPNDKFCNIYDMVASVSEWTTETNADPAFSISKTEQILNAIMSSAVFSIVYAEDVETSSAGSCVLRGGTFGDGTHTAYRNNIYATDSVFDLGFRPLLYVK